MFFFHTYYPSSQLAVHSRPEAVPGLRPRSPRPGGRLLQAALALAQGGQGHAEEELPRHLLGGQGEGGHLKNTTKVEQYIDAERSLARKTSTCSSMLVMYTNADGGHVT